VESWEIASLCLSGESRENLEIASFRAAKDRMSAIVSLE